MHCDEAFAIRTIITTVRTRTGASDRSMNVPSNWMYGNAGPSSFTLRIADGSHASCRQFSGSGFGPVLLTTCIPPAVYAMLQPPISGFKPTRKSRHVNKHAASQHS